MTDTKPKIDPAQHPGPWFIWWSSATGVEPQIWYGEIDDGVSGWRRSHRLSTIPITEEEATYKIDVLARLYPKPELRPCP